MEMEKELAAGMATENQGNNGNEGNKGIQGSERNQGGERSKGSERSERSKGNQGNQGSFVNNEAMNDEASKMMHDEAGEGKQSDGSMEVKDSKVSGEGKVDEAGCEGMHGKVSGEGKVDESREVTHGESREVIMNEGREVTQDDAGGEGPDAGGGVDIEAMIAEAEARGYERGRNEGIDAWMRGGDNAKVNTTPSNAAYDSEVMILNNMRPSIWERS